MILGRKVSDVFCFRFLAAAGGLAKRKVDLSFLGVGSGRKRKKMNRAVP